MPTKASMECLLRLAADSERLMKLPPAALEPVQLTRGYQRILHEAGLATKNGNLRTVRLVSLVKERYLGLEELPGLAPLKAIDDQWPGLAASLSRRMSRPAHPLKHLLLIGAISDSWDHFCEACAHEHPTTNATPTRAPTQEITNATRLDRFKELVTVHGKSLSAAAGVLGVSRSTGTLWARKLKIVYKSRGIPVAKKTAMKINRLLKKGDPISSIATNAGVSMTTVYRIVESDPSISEQRTADIFNRQQTMARRTFSTLCKVQSDQPLKAIRSRPGNSYTWLYRNDHHWLASKLAEYGRVSARSR